SEVSRPRKIENGHEDLARFGADGMCKTPRIENIVEGHVGTQRLKHHTLRFEGQNLAVCPYLPSEEERMSANIGANIQHRVPRLDDLPEQFHFPFGELTVEVQRAANVGIVHVEKHLTVAAGRLTVEDSGMLVGRIGGSLATSLHRSHFQDASKSFFGHGNVFLPSQAARSSLRLPRGLIL